MEASFATPSANVDPHEIAKFAATAHQWWDPEGQYKPLHRLNPLRCRWIGDHLGGFAGKKILDIGCGGGLLSEAMAQQGADVLGIDLGEDALAVAAMHRYESGVAVDYRLISAEALAGEYASMGKPGFDAITCMELLEHVPDPKAVITAAASLLAPHGCLFLSTICRSVKAYFATVIAAEYLLGWVPRGTHDLERFIKPSELAGWGREASLRVTALSGVGYDPWQRCFVLEQAVNVNYMMALCRC